MLCLIWKMNETEKPAAVSFGGKVSSNMGDTIWTRFRSLLPRFSNGVTIASNPFFFIF